MSQSSEPPSAKKPRVDADEDDKSLVADSGPGAAATAAPTLPPIAKLNTAEAGEFVSAVNTLFETAPPLASALLEARPFPSYSSLIDRATTAIKQMPHADQLSVINAHPRIGVDPRKDGAISALSYQEQGLANENPEDEEVIQVYKELDRLNSEYEAKFGFKFVVFVNGRSKPEIVPVLKQRLERDAAAELKDGLQAMMDIARARLFKLLPDGAGADEDGADEAGKQ